MSRWHGRIMPIVVRQPGSGWSSNPRSVVDRPLGNQARPTVLLPSGGATAVASAPAPHRALALDALRVLRILRDHPRDAGPWGEPAFAREVDLIRRHLAPIVSRRALSSSYSREAFRAPTARPTDPSTARPARVAYAVRWLELGDGQSRPGWSELVTERA
jgi:hypothetical protein